MKSVQVAVCGLYGYSRRLSRFEPAKDWNNSSTAALFQTQNYSSVEHEMTVNCVRDSGLLVENPLVMMLVANLPQRWRSTVTGEGFFGKLNT